MQKFKKAEPTDIIGKQILGNANFFIKLPFPKNTFTPAITDCVKKSHVRTPEHRYILYAIRSASIPTNFALMTSENITVYTKIIDNGFKIDHAIPNTEPLYLAKNSLFIQLKINCLYCQILRNIIISLPFTFY